MKEIYFGNDDIDSTDAIDYLSDSGCYSNLIIALMPFYNDEELLVYLWEIIKDEYKEYILNNHKGRFWLNGHYQLLINNTWLY